MRNLFIIFALAFIIPLQAETKEKVTSESAELIGRWYTKEAGGWIYEIHLAENGNYFYQSAMESNPESFYGKYKLDYHEDENTYYVVDSPTKDHFVIKSNGDLEVRDKKGLVNTAKNITQQEVEDVTRIDNINAFSYYELRCAYTRGEISGKSARRVWMNTDLGSFALNGHAITWVQNAKEQGTPLKGSNGRSFKIGREHIQHELLDNLIQRGLRKCN